MRAPAAGRWLVLLLLAVYLLTGGGKGYSVDGAFGFEMARAVFLDPTHEYFHRFKSAFGRWGVLLPALGQPLVLAGDALARISPERDELSIDGHTFRIEEWRPLGPSAERRYLAPAPGALSSLPGGRASALALISFLANGAGIPDGAVVGEVHLWEGEREVRLPVRAGIETAEWAYDRPDVRARVQHARPPVAGHWIGQPRGNYYYARLPLPAPMRVDRWELVAGDGLAGAATWQVAAAAFVNGGAWQDVHTGERYWSPRQTRDFFTRLIYSTLNAFTTAAAAGLVYAIAAQFGYALPVRVAAALGYGLATIAWPYAKMDFAEPAATAFGLVAIWALYRAFPPVITTPAPPAPSSGAGPASVTGPLGRGTVTFPRPQREEGATGRDGWLRPGRALPASLPSTAGAAALGLLACAGLGLAVLGKYTAALLAAGLLGQWALSSAWWRKERCARALAFLAALVVPLLALGLAGIVLAARVAGAIPVVLTAAPERLIEGWLTLPLWTGLRGMLFSPGYGVFVCSPWLLLAIPGAVLLLRRHGRHGLLLVLFPLCVILLYSTKGVWHGGSWGTRYLLPVIPLLSLAAAPCIAWLLQRGRAGAALLALVGVTSAAVQMLAVAKDPQQYPSMAREFAVPSLPDHGSALGGRDYWLARGGDLLSRALQDARPDKTGRGLGYLWGQPTADLEITVREPRTFTLSLYFVDWHRQERRQTVTVQDALGTRTFDLDRDFSAGLWARWLVSVEPEQPLRVGLLQRSRDPEATAVVSAAMFDPPALAWRDAPALDETTTGSWRGVYGSDGYILFAWHAFNVTVASLPPYVAGYHLAHTGDHPDPLVHVQIDEQDILDTPLLYALPFSPILGHLWLLAADLARLLLPGRPDLTAAVLARPPWTWFGIAAAPIPHPEYGLGLDFWPTVLYTNYASHPQVLTGMWSALLAIELLLLAAVYRLARVLASAGRGRAPAVLLTVGVALLLAGFSWLQVQA
jgi:hypothetical protein